MIEAELFVALTSLHFSILDPVLVGITRYPTVCLICARKRAEYIVNQESRKAAARASYYADPKKVKVACRASYNASPKKRAASRVSYRADPEEKRAASRVASRASGLLTACSSKVNGGNFGHVGNFGHSIGN